MDLFCKATGMEINMEKSMMTVWGIFEQEKNHIAQLSPFKMTNLEQNMKYIGFFLKPNEYKKCDW